MAGAPIQSAAREEKARRKSAGERLRDEALVKAAAAKFKYTGLSLREIARRLERAPSGLHKLAVQGKIPRNSDGTFDQKDVLIALGKIAPGRTRWGCARPGSRR